jgi:hypothetical protein
LPAPKVIRPNNEFFESEIFDQLQTFIADHWDRADQARATQVDEHYSKWQKQYEGVPASARRLLPWPGASNFVVQLSRMFIDTFVARTLNIVFATRPLYTIDFLPSETAEAVAKYINRKALYEWQHYELGKGMLIRGAKNGTVVTKTPYVVENEIDVVSGTDGETHSEQTITTYDGPKSTLIPFEDFALYPVTVNKLEEATILFHRLRMVEEEAEWRLYKWAETNTRLTEEVIKSVLEQATMPSDVKRTEEQAQAGVTDAHLKELHLVECHLKYPITNDRSRYYQIIALLEPKTRKILDLYYNPYPKNLRIFQDYRPAPREDFFYGESWCQILEQAQEEASTIHNDRRNNSYIANAPVFKRRSGSLLPNPSTNWYPGKVFDLEDMADFEIVMAGRNYNDMLAEENHILMLAERLVGIGAVMQGNAAGMMGKRGIYNAAGTLAVLSESNQRQDTNIRDIRQVLGAVGRLSYMLQREYGANDPVIDMFPADIAARIREGLARSTPNLLANSYFEIKPSNAGANSEVEKANLLQMASVVGQYGAAVPQMARMLLEMGQNTQNPMYGLLLKTAQMQKWMAGKLIRAMGEFDTDGLLPDLARAFGAGDAGSSPQPGAEGAPPALLGGGTPTPDGSSLQQMLAGISEVPLPTGEGVQ